MQYFADLSSRITKLYEELGTIKAERELLAKKNLFPVTGRIKADPVLEWKLAPASPTPLLSLTLVHVLPPSIKTYLARVCNLVQEQGSLIGLNVFLDTKKGTLSFESVSARLLALDMDFTIGATISVQDGEIDTRFFYQTYPKTGERIATFSIATRRGNVTPEDLNRIAKDLTGDEAEAQNLLKSGIYGSGITTDLKRVFEFLPRQDARINDFASINMTVEQIPDSLDSLMTFRAIGNLHDSSTTIETSSDGRFKLEAKTSPAKLKNLILIAETFETAFKEIAH